VRSSSSLAAILKLTKYLPVVLTASQREIFDKVKEFVLSNRGASASVQRAARLAMPNTFPGRDRKFVTELADALHLRIAWDEYDDADQNLVTLRLPGADISEPLPTNGAKRNGDDGEWEDVDEADSEEEEESNNAVDRVLKKYETAHVAKTDEEGDFDARHDRALQEKMDQWKREYYKVRGALAALPDFGSVSSRTS
jgi:5'-3' exoribonuclease 1